LITLQLHIKNTKNLLQNKKFYKKTHFIEKYNLLLDDVSPNRRPDPRFRLRNDGSLFISGVSTSDPRSYTCADAETNDSIETILIDVKSVPPAVTNLTVLTHSVYALVAWVLPGNGGYPIKNFVLSYRLDQSQPSEKVTSIFFYKISTIFK
jgi:hypothetical protein